MRSFKAALTGGLARLGWLLKAPSMLFLGTVAVALGLVALVAWTTLDLRRLTLEAAARSEQNIATILSEDIQRQIQLYDLALKSVLSAQERPWVNRLSPQLRRQVLFNDVSTAVTFGNILVLDQNGDLVLDSRSTARDGTYRADRDYFKVHRDRADVGLYVSRT